MIKRIDYLASDGSVFFVSFTYNADNTVKEINMSDQLKIKAIYSGGGLDRVDVYQEDGSLMITGTYNFMGNNITIDQNIYDPAKTVKSVVRVLRTAGIKASAATTRTVKRHLADPPGHIYTRIVLSNGNPVTFSAFYPIRTGFSEQFGLDFTEDGSYKTRVLDDAGPVDYSAGIYAGFDATLSPFPDHSVLLCIFCLPNCFMFTEKFFPEILSIQPQNFTSYKLSSIGCAGSFSEDFVNTTVAGQLTERNFASGSTPPLTKITYKY